MRTCRNINLTSIGCLLLAFGFLTLKAGAQIKPDTLVLQEFEYIEQKPEDNRGIKENYLDSNALKQAQNKDLGGVLQNQSPVFIKSYGVSGIKSPAFRGTGSGHTQVNWNGIPVNSPMHGQADLSLMPAELFDYVGIVHGGAYQDVRSGALGGAVNVGQNRKLEPHTHLSFKPKIGSFDRYEGFLKADWGNKQMNVATQAYHRQAQNDFTFQNYTKPEAPGEKRKNAAFRQSGIMNSLFYQVDENDQVGVQGWYQSTDREVPGPLTSPNPDQDQEDENLWLTAHWQHKFDHGTLQYRGGYLYDKIHYTDQNIQLDALNKSRSITNEAKYKTKLAKNTVLSGGVAFDHYEAHSENFGGWVDQQRSTLFANLLHRFSTILAIDASARKTLIDDEFVPIIPSLGLNLMPFSNKGIVFSGNVYRNYKVPTLNDLYWDPGGTPELQPEQGIGYEVGMAYSTYQSDQFITQFKVEANAYRSNIEDWILWYPTDDNFWKAENLKKVLNRGIETKLALQFSLGGFSASLKGQYAYTEAQNQQPISGLDNSEGKQLIYTPYHKSNFTASIEKWGIRLFYHHNYTGERYTTRDNSEYVESYNLGAMGLSKDFKPSNNIYCKAQIKLNNILDEQYQVLAWRPMPGRNFMGSLEIGYRD